MDLYKYYNSNELKKDLWTYGEANGLENLEALQMANPEQNWRLEVLQEVIILFKKPEIGMGATVRLYTDCHSYTVVSKSDSGKTITLQRDKVVLDPKFTPEWVTGGFAGRCTNNSQQKWISQPDPKGTLIKARFSYKKLGYYIKGNSKAVKLGIRNEYYDYNF